MVGPVGVALSVTPVPGQAAVLGPRFVPVGTADDQGGRWVGVGSAWAVVVQPCSPPAASHPSGTPAGGPWVVIDGSGRLGNPEVAVGVANGHLGGGGVVVCLGA